MSINIRNRHVAWISVIVISLALLGVAVGQYASGGPVPLIVGHPLHVTDIHDDQKLAGISHNVWFGQVDAKTSQVEDKDDEPYTLYSVTVLESLKGTLPDRGWSCSTGWTSLTAVSTASRTTRTYWKLGSRISSRPFRYSRRRTSPA